MGLRKQYKDVDKPSASAVKWKRIRLPEDTFRLSESATTAGNIKVDDGVEIHDAKKIPDNQIFEELIERKQQNLGRSFVTHVEEHHDVSKHIKASKASFDAKRIAMSYELKDDLIDQYVITAESGSHLALTLDYSSKTDERAIHHGITKLHAKAGSKVNLFKIQRLNGDSANFDQNFVVVDEGAEVNIVDVQLGSASSAISYQADLMGRHSSINIGAIYLGDHREQLDLAYTVNHKGPESRSTILGKGTVKGKCKKVFRGNLFFEKGARHSIGREEEFVILMDDQVTAHSIPTLMCSEDDVIGEHSANIGQVKEETLFYLMSRGLSEKDAKKLIIRGAYEDVLDEIPYSDIREIIQTTIERRL